MCSKSQPALCQWSSCRLCRNNYRELSHRHMRYIVNVSMLLPECFLISASGFLSVFFSISCTHLWLCSYQNGSGTCNLLLQSHKKRCYKWLLRTVIYFVLAKCIQIHLSNYFKHVHISLNFKPKLLKKKIWFKINCRAS